MTVKQNDQYNTLSTGGLNCATFVEEGLQAALGTLGEGVPVTPLPSDAFNAIMQGNPNGVYSQNC